MSEASERAGEPVGERPRTSDSEALDRIAKEFEWIDTIGNAGLTQGDLCMIRRAVQETGRLGERQ